MEKELVILMSGGMDSVLAYYYAVKEKGYKPEDILALWFDIGHPYARKEEQVIDRLPFPVEKIRIDLIRDEFDNVPGKEDGKQIIPGRNLIFATIASSFGKRIWLMALDGERHKFAKERDKSEKFFRDTTDLLTYVFNISREETIIETPFENMTKAEVIAWALENDVPEEIIHLTSTCYDGEIRNCGECPSCFKRWVALTVNGLEEEFEVDPKSLISKGWHKDYIKTLAEALAKEDFSHYSEKRCRETLTAVGKL